MTLFHDILLITYNLVGNSCLSGRSQANRNSVLGDKDRGTFKCSVQVVDTYINRQVTASCVNRPPSTSIVWSLSLLISMKYPHIDGFTGKGGLWCQHQRPLLCHSDHLSLLRYTSSKSTRQGKAVWAYCHISKKWRVRSLISNSDRRMWKDIRMN